jgi:hypothetical protein
MSADGPDDQFWEAELERFLPDVRKALEEAFEYVCCPICEVIADVPFDYFAVLPKRWAEEPELREIVCQAGGFCRHHTWRLDKVQGSLPIATIYADVLSSRMQEERPQDPCPVCHLQGLMERVLLAAFVEQMADPGAREGYRGLFGVCYPHYQLLLAQDLDEAARQALTNAQMIQTVELIRLLRGYIEKDDVPAKWSRTDAEVRAPRRALLKAAGNEDQ